MPIIVSNPTYTVNPAPDTPLFQDWNSSTPFNINHSIQGRGLPVPITAPVTIKDVIGTPSGDNYSQKRLIISKNYITNPSNIDWLNCISETQILSDYLINTYENGLTKTLVLTVNNINIVPIGNYELNIVFKIEGKIGVFTPWQTITKHIVKVYLNVSEEAIATYTPSEFNLLHIQNTAFPYKDILMSGNNWKLIAGLNYTLSSPNNDVTITTVAYPNGNRMVAESSDNKTVRVSLTSYFNLPAALTEIFTSLINVYQNNTFLGNITFDTVVLANDGFVVIPNELDYFAYKNLLEATPIIIDVYTNWPYTFTKPYWLNMEAIAESAPGITSKFIVTPISSSNLNKGVYQDKIYFYANNGSQIVVDEVLVTHTVHENIILPYLFDKNNFTKDPVFIQFISEIADTYFEIEIIAKVYDFFFQSIESIDYQVPLKIVLFKNQQKENIGLLIEKMLFSFFLPNAYSTQLYNAADVKLKFRERLYLDNSIVTEIETQNMKFLSGLTPENVYNNCAILDINTNSKRVTSKSFAYVNMMLSPGVKNISIIKNNTINLLVYSISPLTDTYKETIRFSDFNITKGDKVDFIVDVDNNLIISKSFIVFPDSDFSTMILFEDEARMLQSFEFTGKYSLKDEYESISQILYQNLVEVLKKYDYTKDVSFSINTGFITSSDKRTIQSICECKRAWVYLSDDKMIEIIPLTKTLPVMDVDTEVISFDLEFQINRKYNEESYTF